MTDKAAANSSSDGVAGAQGDAAHNSVIPNLSAAAPRRIPRFYFGAGAAIAVIVLGVVGWQIYSHARNPEGNESHAPTPAVSTGAVGNRHFASVPPAPTAPTTGKPSAELAAPPLVPAIEPDPIDVRSTAAGAGTPNDRRRTANASIGRKPDPIPAYLPEDAPILLMRTADAFQPAPSAPARASADELTRVVGQSTDPAVRARQRLDQLSAQASATLDAINRQLDGSAGSTLHPAGSIAGTPMSTATAAASNPSSALLGGALPSSATPSVLARMLGDRSLTLPKGTTFNCALTTRAESTVAGFIGCQVLRNVYGDDGRVLLVERGSHLDGEYRSTQVHPGLTRIPAVWTRLRTPTGVVIDLDSPATGSLGESGIEGTVDNRWGERIGAALLVAMIDDGLAAAVNAAGGGSTNTGNGTFVLSNTAGAGSHLADKVLDATINLPPRIVRDQGGVVGVFVARDIDFSSVYALQPSAR